MTDAERQQYIVDFYMGSPAKPVWYQGCRGCANSWLYGEPEYHAAVCVVKAEEKR